MTRLLLIPLTLLALLFGSMALSSGPGEEKADLTYINRGDVNTLDLNRMSWAQDIRLAYALWEGLYTLNPQTLEPIPGAAETIDISPDGKIYTFHLRPNGKWTNGDPVTAKDFIFSWRRLLENPDEYSSLFHCIVGAETYQDLHSAWVNYNQYSADPGKWPEDQAIPKKPDAEANFNTVEMKAVDPLTLRVTLVNATAYFPSLTAFPAFFPSHQTSMDPFSRRDSKTGQVTYSEAYTHAGNLVTNGPYRLAKWEFKQKVRVVASDYYWNKAEVKLKIIDQIACDDPLAMYLMYRSGTVDWLLQVDESVAAELLKRGDSELHSFPSFGTYFYSVNCQEKLKDGTKNPFHDARVRQAFGMVMNKTPVVQTIVRSGEKVVDTYIPPEIFRNYPSRGGLGYDPAKARQLLAEAGYPGGKGLPRITFLYNTGSHHGDVAQIFRRQWLDELGVDVELQGIELASFRERLNKKDYMMARASWMGDYNDPTTFLDKYRSTSHGNDAGWVNLEYDAKLDAALVETDPVKRFALLADAEAILNREMPVIPIYSYTNSFLIRKHLKNIPFHAQGLFLYHTIESEKQ